MSNVVKLYQILRSIRYQILLSQFGFVSHCPHTPTCGTRFVRVAQKKGVLYALLTQTWRALRCY